MYEIEGVVKEIYETQTFNSGFTKREFVVTTQEKYPQDIKLEVVKDRCSLLDSINKGERVKATFSIRGNEYNGKYYVNLQAWKIEAQKFGAADDSEIPMGVDASFGVDQEDPF